VESALDEAGDVADSVTSTLSDAFDTYKAALEAIPSGGDTTLAEASEEITAAVGGHASRCMRKHGREVSTARLDRGVPRQDGSKVISVETSDGRQALTNQGSVRSMYFSTFISSDHSANLEATSSGISPCSPRRAADSVVK
jgi:hypothetical protein